MTAPVLRGGAGRGSDLALRIAQMRYEEGLQQTVIARILGVSEATVSRALKRAFDLGLVEIRVVPDALRQTALEERLVRRFGLAFAVVVAPRSGEPDTRRALGEAVARVLSDRIEGGMVVGVSDGETTSAVAASARRVRNGRADVVALIGGVGEPQAVSHPNEVCRILAERLGGQAWQLPAPVLIESVEAARSVREASAVGRVFSEMERLSLAIVGIGAASETAAIVRNGAFSSSDMTEAIRAGAVGSVCARFYGADGAPVAAELGARTLAISFPQLVRTPVRLAVAFGPGKARAIRAALGGAVVNAIGTDAETARLLIDPPR